MATNSARQAIASEAVGRWESRRLVMVPPVPVGRACARRPSNRGAVGELRRARKKIEPGPKPGSGKRLCWLRSRVGPGASTLRIGSVPPVQLHLRSMRAGGPLTTLPVDDRDAGVAEPVGEVEADLAAGRRGCWRCLAGRVGVCRVEAVVRRRS